MNRGTLWLALGIATILVAMLGRPEWVSDIRPESGEKVGASDRLDSLGETERSVRLHARHRVAQAADVEEFLGNPGSAAFIDRLQVAVANDYAPRVVAHLERQLQQGMAGEATTRYIVELVAVLRPTDAAFLAWSASKLAEKIMDESGQEPGAAAQDALLLVINKLIDTGQFATATQVARHAARMHPDSVSIIKSLALAAGEAGETAVAIDLLQRLPVHDEGTANQLARLHHAQSAVQAEQNGPPAEPNVLQAEDEDEDEDEDDK